MKSVMDLEYQNRSNQFVWFGFVSAIVFGLGMVMTMVWGMMTLGIILGFVGVLMLAALLPMVKEFEEYG